MSHGCSIKSYKLYPLKVYILVATIASTNSYPWIIGIDFFILEFYQAFYGVMNNSFKPGMTTHIFHRTPTDLIRG